MESKFQVGDRVKVVASILLDDENNDIGATGTVIAIDGSPGFNAFVRLDDRVPSEGYRLLATLFDLPADGVVFLDEELELLDV